MADKEAELHDLSEERDNESLHEQDQDTATYVWWPNIDTDIEAQVKRYNHCQLHHPPPSTVLMQNTSYCEMKAQQLQHYNFSRHSWCVVQIVVHGHLKVSSALFIVFGEYTGLLPVKSSYN